VIAQQPAAGVAVERGARVEMWLAAPPDSNGTTLPLLTGLTVREALRELTRLQVSARVVGQGVVVRQDPPPGTRLPLRGHCVLGCEARAPAGTVALAPGRAAAVVSAAGVAAAGVNP
jgi:beta-lactam-binding protein with PASTA domain